MSLVIRFLSIGALLLCSIASVEASSTPLPTSVFQGLSVPAPKRWKSEELVGPGGSSVYMLERGGRRFSVALIPNQAGDDLISPASVEAFITGLTRQAHTISKHGRMDYQGRDVLVVDSVRGGPERATYSRILAWVEGPQIVSIALSSRYPRPETDDDLIEMLQALRLPPLSGGVPAAVAQP